MPRTGTASPSVRRTEHSDRENSDEEDAVTPNLQEQHDSTKPETGMNDYSESKNDSDSSLNDGGSDGDNSFVGKIRSNFSGMLSALLPARQSKRAAGGMATTRQSSEQHSNAKTIFDEHETEARLSLDLRKRPHSPNLVDDSDVDNNVNRTYDMIRKRPRLRETADTSEETSIRPTSDTLRARSASFNASHRLGGLMSNSAYRNRMQQSRGGFVHKTLFGSSHLKFTKNRNDSVASSRRPSFNVSAAKISKSLSNGWIPPEYGGSPFYEGLTRFGGASSARTLASHGPSRPAVTVLVKKSHTPTTAQSLPDAPLEASPEKNTSTLSYPSRRILEIVNEYSVKSLSTKREMSLSTNDIRTPRTLQMLNLIRSQQLERSEETEQPPPTEPVMEYTLPSHIDNTTSPTGKDEPKSTGGGKQVTKKTRLHADPIKERDEPTVEPIQLPNLKLPLLEGLPKFDFTVPMKGPLLQADKEQGQKHAKSTNGDKLPANDENKKQGEFAKNTSAPTTTFKEIRSFGFTSPMPLKSSSHVADSVPVVPKLSASETSISLFREMTTFVFTSPKLLNGSSQSTTSSLPTAPNVTVTLHREKRTFVFASPLVLGNSNKPVPAATMLFKFASPEPVQVPEAAPKVRSFQELMAESASKWTCDVCMIRNEPQQQKCIACESPKPAAVPAKKKEQFLPASTAEPLQVPEAAPKVRSFQELMAESASKWTCDVCMIRNEPQQQKCIACESSKPAAAAVPATNKEQFLPAVKFASTEPLRVPEAAPKVRSFQELMAETANKWTCDVCMIRNEPQQQKCIACESPKPAAAAVPATKKEQFLPVGTNSFIPTSGSFAAIVNAQSSRWECPACSVRNEPTASVCVCCATEKPAG